MKTFIIGLVFGLIISSSGFVFAENPIKLLINGTEINTEVSPQLIDGKTMIPVRSVSEHLGYNVKWENNSVSIESKKPYDLNDDWINIKTYGQIPFLVETKEGYVLNVLTSNNLYELLLRDNEVYIKNTN